MRGRADVWARAVPASNPGTTPSVAAPRASAAAANMVGRIIRVNEGNGGRAVASTDRLGGPLPPMGLAPVPARLGPYPRAHRSVSLGASERRMLSDSPALRGRMKLHRTIFVLALTTVMPTWAAPADAASCGSEDLVAGKSPTASQDARGDLKLITDGAVGAEGTLWNAPVVVTLETPAGSVTYDLGEARQVSALVVQADANDTYKVLGSVDGTPSSYKPIVAFANVVNRGPGLRTRAIEIPPTTVRYLRVGEGEGDGFYSISEFAAYCRTPTPFPPMMRIADAPMEAGPTPQRAGQTETGNRPRSSPIGALQLVLGAAILLLAGARLSSKKQSPAGTEVSVAGAALGYDRPVRESKSEQFFPWVLLLFFGSGCAALMYEIIW